MEQPVDVERRGYILKALQESAIDRRELENGYAIKFPGDAESERRVFEFITLERECCRFLSFELRLGAERGAIWVEVTGPAGVKEFARAEMTRFGLDLNAEPEFPER